MPTRTRPASAPVPVPLPKPLRPRRFVWWLLPVLLLTTALGAMNLDQDPIWNDEFYSIYDSGGPPYGPLTVAEIWDRVATRNPWHAPGFFTLLAQWGRFVGWTPPVLRALALLVGVLGVAWTYRLGRDLVSPRVGLYAATVLGTSAFFVYYLHELRMYTFFVLWTSFVVWVYLRLVSADHTTSNTRRRRRDRWLWAGLLVGAVGMLYTHYFSVLPLVAIGLYHLLFVPKDRRWWGVVGVMGLAAVAFLPWLPVLLKSLQMAEESEGLHARALSTPVALERLVFLFSNGVPLLAAALAVIVFVLLISGRTRFTRPAGWGARRAVFFAAATVAAILVTNAILEIMHEGRVRYLISAWPLLALVAGVGFAALGRFAPVALAVWVGAGLVAGTNGTFAEAIDGGAHSLPLQTIAAELRDDVLPDDVLVQYVPDGLDYVDYARNNDITQFYFNGVIVHPVIGRTTRDPAAQAEQDQLQRDGIGDALRVWLAYDPSKPSATLPRFTDELDQRYDACGVAHDSADLRIVLFTRVSMCCTPDDARPAVITYGDGVAFTGLEPPRLEDDTLKVVTAWSISPDTPRDVYSVALHVTDSADTLVAQGDFGLPRLDGACEEIDIPLGGLPSGDYRLYLIVYRWQDGVRLTGTHADTGEPGDRLLLAPIEIP